MRPEPLSGVGRLLRLSRAWGTRAGEHLCSGCPARFCARAAFLRLALC